MTIGKIQKEDDETLATQQSLQKGRFDFHSQADLGGKNDNHECFTFLLLTCFKLEINF